MRELSVCCIMITANRPEMAKRAVECFRAQSYANKRLMIYDSGREPDWYKAFGGAINEVQAVRIPNTTRTIGELRNEAGGLAYSADIICHWDDDDISHPNRISEQVALLQSSGADAVGYNECLFWRDVMVSSEGPRVMNIIPGEAWLYSNSNPRYVLGTSLCYWRKCWEKRPFEALNDGEDTAWRMGVKCIGVSSLFERRATYSVSQQPRMICSIHAGNTSPWYRPELLRASEKQGGEWKRVSDWDKYCADTMK